MLSLIMIIDNIIYIIIDMILYSPNPEPQDPSNEENYDDYNYGSYGDYGEEYYDGAEGINSVFSGNLLP